ncbi:hypothetical protein U0026_09135 [Kluyvera intermedia]|uniref:hypothetical protein n=1 Tax=Kluyvera intermedia TaxID=61648 RepID=UPI000789734F|nr:hypothetical protein [Kluyvera intermedia]WQD31375.1 hypothetical protein U0026_09135 [Kluyvera intermedia]VDZ82689.1 Uncharacterised protein [Kluyvera intermedia]
MSNEITPLAQRMKAAALKAKSEANEWGYDTDAFHDEATPDAVIQVVEALEKAQAINAAAEKLVRCKVRYHSELNYRALAALFGVNTPDLPPMEGESRTVTVKLPALNDDLIAILGRPNFLCAHLAELLRKSGEEIKRKSENEQAAVIHWFLGIYLEHGDKWESVAKSDIQARVAGIQVIEGE